jgi:hypothetical protein
MYGFENQFMKSVTSLHAKAIVGSLINIAWDKLPDLTTAKIMTLSHRARKRIREAKKKARPGTVVFFNLPKSLVTLEI